VSARVHAPDVERRDRWRYSRLCRRLNRKGHAMKVLVTAASRHGSTAEIATIVAGVLQASDIDAEVLPPEAVASVADYDAVILGSAVYDGEWLEPARAFVARHADDLTTRPVFLFSSGPLGYPTRRPDEPADAVAVELMTGAMDLQVFPGRLVGRELDLRERLFATRTHAPYGDFRPWDDIIDWTREIVRYLCEESVAAGDVRRAERTG
jgi:menaquinone-dependent protoporphyrinogen oxidase